jgi:recombination protein RecA
MTESIQKALANIEKSFGKGAVMNFDGESDKSIKRFSTGSLGLDLAIGGGWPCGRIIELFGPESSGKSTLALHAVAECQKEEGVAVYIDAEQAFDPTYAEYLGVSLTENFHFSQPDSGEQAFGIIEEFIKTNAVRLIIVDSVAALVPKAELEGDFGESKMGLHARLMSQAMRKLVGLIRKTDCTVIFINQLRMKIGVMYGNPETTTGGEALKFYASIRCDIRRSGAAEKDKDEVAVANKVKVKVVKNKTYPPFKECFFNIVYGKGIDRNAEILDVGVELDIIEKRGSWYSFGGSNLGQGADKVRELFENDPDVMRAVLNEIYKKLK